MLRCFLAGLRMPSSRHHDATVTVACEYAGAGASTEHIDEPQPSENGDRQERSPVLPSAGTVFRSARERFIRLLLFLLALMGVAVYVSLTVDIRPFHCSLSSSPSHSTALSADRPCHGGQYADGEWVRSDHEWYPYLTGDKHTRSCDTSNSTSIWQLNSTEVDVSALPPDNSLLNSTQLYVRPALKYVWTPSQCVLKVFPRWSPVDFCLALSSRPILFVGDSISYQQYQSLTFLLGDSSRNDQLQGGNSDICNRLMDAHYTLTLHRLCTQSVGSWPYGDTPRQCVNGRWSGERLPQQLNSSHVRIRFVRNDHLSDVQSTIWNKLGTRTDVENPWRALVTPTTLLVVNSGVHVIEPAVFREQLTEMLQWLRSTHPCVTIFWRSSVPGHADCNSVWHQLPLTRSQYAHFDRQDQLLHRGNSQYMWEKVRKLNEVAREVIHSPPWSDAPTCPSSASYRIGGVYELDVDSFDKLRPDAHRPSDCLHQCLPGPVDTWTRLLYNVLIGNAS